MSLRGWLDTHFLRKTSSANEQLDVLDGLRGIAVLLVVLSHASNLDRHLLPGADFEGTGKYGVYLFFVLSAFLLTRPLVGAQAELGSAASWGRYALRRALRIFPLYWVVLATNWFFTEVAPTQAFPTLSTERWVQHMWLREGKGLYWAVPVELTYYLVIPVYAGFVRLVRGDLRLVAAGTAALLVASSLAFPPGETPRNSLNLGYYLPVFALGSFAAVVERQLPRGTAAGYDALAALGLAVALALFPSVVEAATGRDVDKSFLHTSYVGFGLVWSAVVVGLVRGRTRLVRWVSHPFLRLVGVVSFSVYLWHVPILRALVMLELPSPFATAWLTVAVSLAAAMLSYLAIEKPFVHGALAPRWLRKRR